ncbi:aldo/keto reductase [Gryllotalpicola daejeonensis]|uniref:Aldo/keto reductase n=1 Tax=Gryllotalpicola daejeonensis TaxID=993087 RepID=A0ABP7ZNU9_9MICO
MTWIASSATERRAQLGRFLLGTGGIGGIAVATGPGLGLDEAAGLALIDRAVAEGVKVIDTADVYTGGESERVVGVWNRSHPDADVLIQTKTGMTAAGPNLNPERIGRQLQHSIDVIGRVDLYVAHTVDPNTPWAESLPVFSDAVERGTIKAYGLSNVDGPTLAAALETADRLGLARPEVVQNQYSLLARADDAEVLPIVASEGLAYTPFSPLANGLLAGRYSNGERPQTGDRASVASSAAPFLDYETAMAKVRAFDELAAAHAVSQAALAMAWLFHHPLVTAPIVGVSKEHHWAGILDGLALDWNEKLAAEVEAIFG